VPQTVTQHETFGQEGDEYKLPVAANIPDATTDPSQIRVLPVVDPTAKPAKGSDAGGAQATSGENVRPIKARVDPVKTAGAGCRESSPGPDNGHWKCGKCGR
jgi:hypothetical protein